MENGLSSKMPPLTRKRTGVGVFQGSGTGCVSIFSLSVDLLILMSYMYYSMECILHCSRIGKCSNFFHCFGSVLPVMFTHGFSCGAQIYPTKNLAACDVLGLAWLVAQMLAAHDNFTILANC
jgi:hypothetical protein